MNRLPRAAMTAMLLLLAAGCVGPPMHRPLPPEAGVQPASAFGQPLKHYSVLSGFGERGHRFHTGVDLQGNRQGGDPVLASRAGVVVRAETRNGYGRMVELQHRDGYSTRYAHLRRIQVRLGQTVTQGEQIGTVGSTGRATTPHLHFEILTPAYRFVDPRPYLEASRKEK